MKKVTNTKEGKANRKKKQLERNSLFRENNF